MEFGSTQIVHLHRMKALIVEGKVCNVSECEHVSIVLNWKELVGFMGVSLCKIE